MSSPKIEISKATNYEYLKAKNLLIEIPKNKVHRLLLVKYIYEQLTGPVRQRLKQLNEIVSGIGYSTLHNFYKEKFDFTELTLGKKCLSDKKQVKADSKASFYVHLIDVDTLTPKLTFRFSKQAVYEVQVKPEVKIDMNKVLQIREEAQNSQSHVNPKSRREREKLVIEICQYLASGIFTLPEACNKCQVAMKDFVAWIHTDPIMAQHVQQANLARKFIEETNAYLNLTKYRQMLIAEGKRMKTKISYKKIFTPEYIHGVYVEGDKEIYQEQFTLGEVTNALKSIEENILPQVIPGDDSGGKSKEEMQQDLNKLREQYMEALQNKMNRKNE